MGTSGSRSSAGGSPARADRGGVPASRRESIEQREYDPRREERRKATRVALPDDVDARMLDDEARRELRSLSKETSELVARHLVMTGRLLDDEPEQALAHARAARALAGRIGVVRLATGLAAYAAQEWNEALSELRAARRITGKPEHLAVQADCERALGRPERALAYGEDPEVPALSQDERVELVIVLAGARRDMGQLDAAVLALQDPARRTTAKRPWAVRLWYAFADALLVAGRESDAREWFTRTVDADTDGQTDAGDRLLELDGFVLDDLDRGDEPSAPALDDAELTALVADGFRIVGDVRTTRPPAAGSAPDALAEPHVEVEPQSPSMVDPFAGVGVDQVMGVTRRPAAALTPTFAAPADQPADQPGAPQPGEPEIVEVRDALRARDGEAVDGGDEDEGELTLFS